MVSISDANIPEDKTQRRESNALGTNGEECVGKF